ARLLVDPGPGHGGPCHRLDAAPGAGRGRAAATLVAGLAEGNDLAARTLLGRRLRRVLRVQLLSARLPARCPPARIDHALTYLAEPAPAARLAHHRRRAGRDPRPPLALHRHGCAHRRRSRRLWRALG